MLEFASGRFNTHTLIAYRYLLVYPTFLEFEQESAEELQKCQDDLKADYKALDEYLESSNTKFVLSDDEPTLADFYLGSMVICIVENNLINIDEFPKMLNWYQNLFQIPAMRTLKVRYTRWMKLANLFVGYLRPLQRMIKCKAPKRTKKMK